MSSTLYWEPVKESNKYVCDELKHILKSRDDGDINITYNEFDLQFLEGVVCSTSGRTKKDAQELIDAINKYGYIKLTEVYS